MPYYSHLYSHCEKDSTHALSFIEHINQNQNFEPKYLFSVDVTSLYTCIPQFDGLKALKHFLEKRATKDPPTGTIIPIAELVLKKNICSFRDIACVCARALAGAVQPRGKRIIAHSVIVTVFRSISLLQTSSKALQLSIFAVQSALGNFAVEPITKLLTCHHCRYKIINNDISKALNPSVSNQPEA